MEENLKEKDKNLFSEIPSSISKFFKTSLTIDEDNLKEYLKSAESLHSLTNNMNVTKKFNDEEMIAIEPLYVRPGQADSDKEGITTEGAEQLVKAFNDNIETIKSSIHHSYYTEGFHPLKAYVMPIDVYVGDISNPDEMSFIAKGQPVVEMKFENKDYWEKRKSGFLGSVSIGCKATKTLNPDYTGEE